MNGEGQIRSLRPMPLLLLLAPFIGVHSANGEPVELRRKASTLMF